MSSTKLKADVREVLGAKVKSLRANGLIPANVFGKGVDSLSIQINSDAFKKAFSEAGETGVIELTIGSETRPVLVDNIQVHPVNDEILHVDLRQVNLKEKIKANVPLEFVGVSPVEKLGLVVVEQLTEVEVEALPTDLPEKFEIDLSAITDLESVIMIKDLQVPANVEVQADPELIIVNVTEPKEEVMEVVEPEAEVGAEGEEGKEKAEESETSESEETPSEDNLE